MFDRVLIMPLDYLSCFATVLIGIYGKVNISQTDYSICFKLRILPYSGGKFNKRLTIWKVSKYLKNLMFLFFHFLCSNVPENRYLQQKQHILFFKHIKLVACVLARVHAIAHIKLRRLPWQQFLLCRNWWILDPLFWWYLQQLVG